MALLLLFLQLVLCLCLLLNLISFGWRCHSVSCRCHKWPIVTTERGWGSTEKRLLQVTNVQYGAKKEGPSGGGKGGEGKRHCACVLLKIWDNVICEIVLYYAYIEHVPGGNWIRSTSQYPVPSCCRCTIVSDLAQLRTASPGGKSLQRGRLKTHWIRMRNKGKGGGGCSFLFLIFFPLFRICFLQSFAT